MPQDRVLDLLGNDHTVFADDLAEFTGLWLQDSLLKFVKGNDECMLVNGSSGSGKTTLAATVMERLQRPIARQTFQSVFVTIGKLRDRLGDNVFADTSQARYRPRPPHSTW